VQDGPALAAFQQQFAHWLGVPYAFGTATGRSAFQLALEALDLAPGTDIIFPALTFPVIPMMAKLLGYRPVFCDVDLETGNAGPAHIAARLTPHTGAIVATHLFGQPCPIQEIVALAQQHGIRVVEDCAHACGVRIAGRQVGIFGDIGVFSFAEGKNMSCFGGGAMATADARLAQRAAALMEQASVPTPGTVLGSAVSILAKWLLTRPPIFALTVYPVLRLQSLLGRALMDSVVGDALLTAECSSAHPQVRRMANLQASIGLRHLRHIDAFNAGARRNAQLLTTLLADVPGIAVPSMTHDQHIYVYYPLSIPPQRREPLRRYLLRHGIDTKHTDMSDCTTLRAFADASAETPPCTCPDPAGLLEICVYPVITPERIRHIARVIRAWASVSESMPGAAEERQHAIPVPQTSARRQHEVN
jgi:dTDP-4-amino-4,6-dideoxygalactose transaminase